MALQQGGYQDLDKVKNVIGSVCRRLTNWPQTKGQAYCTIYRRPLYLHVACVHYSVSFSCCRCFIICVQH